MKIDWRKEFREAQGYPKPSLGMSREVYERDKEEIESAAKAHRFKRIDWPKMVSFQAP